MRAKIQGWLVIVAIAAATSQAHAILPHKVPGDPPPSTTPPPVTVPPNLPPPTPPPHHVPPPYPPPPPNSPPPTVPPGPPMNCHGTPEPTTLCSGLIGFGLVGWYSLRRRRRPAKPAA